jgi:hypothetical protein
MAAPLLALSACGSGPADSEGVAAIPTTSSRPASSVASTATSQARVQGTSAPTSSAAGAAGAGAANSQAAIEQQEIEYSTCMRSHGITAFPDPNPGGGFQIPVGMAHAPVFQAAQRACQHDLPPGPGSGPPPSAQAMAQMLKIARCMRREGISEFPDPRTTAPPHPFPDSGIGMISDIDGVILVFPSTIDLQSPQFARAAAACHFPLHNH